MVGPTARPTIARSGWLVAPCSPPSRRRARFVLTYRKGKTTFEPRSASPHTFTDNAGVDHDYPRRPQRQDPLGRQDKKRRLFACRQITRLDPATGHQTQIITSRTDPDPALIAHACSRWRKTRTRPPPASPLPPAPPARRARRSPPPTPPPAAAAPAAPAAPATAAPPLGHPPAPPASPHRAPPRRRPLDPDRQRIPPPSAPPPTPDSALAAPPPPPADAAAPPPPPRPPRSTPASTPAPAARPPPAPPAPTPLPRTPPPTPTPTPHRPHPNPRAPSWTPPTLVPVRDLEVLVRAAPPAGFEPATIGLEVRCSIH